MMLVVVSSAASRASRDVRLHVRVIGDGAVSLASGLECLSNCTIAGGRGQLVTLRAVPQQRFAFVQWSGACVGAASQCVISLDASLSLRAVFERKPVHVAVTVKGDGSVRNRNGDCSQGCEVKAGAPVELRAVPSPGSVFSSWGGACAAFTADTCSLKASADVTRVTATFAFAPVTPPAPNPVGPAIWIALRPKAQTLPPGGTSNFSIAVANNGTLTLTNLKVVDALAPKCNYDATRAGYIGTLASGQTLTYVCSRPNVQSSFDNVVNAVGTPAAGQNVTASDSASVRTRPLAPPEPEKFPLNVTSSIRGTVTSQPPGISCGKGGVRCTSSFGRFVTLTARAVIGYHFVSWKKNNTCNKVKGVSCIVLLPVPNPRSGPVATFAP